MTPLLSATWSPRPQALSDVEPATVTHANQQLMTALLAISGRYLSGIAWPTGEHLRFRYRVRAEESGFVKIDLQHSVGSDEPIVGGCDLAIFPRERFLSFAERYYRFAGWSDGAISFIPAVAFGVVGNYGFYIESLHGFAVIEPFFVRAAHEFLALLVAQTAPMLGRSPIAYVNAIMTGDDSEDILAREPLMCNIISELPEESRAPFFRQLGAELTRLVSQTR